MAHVIYLQSHSSATSLLVKAPWCTTGGCSEPLRLGSSREAGGLLVATPGPSEKAATAKAAAAVSAAGRRRRRRERRRWRRRRRHRRQTRNGRLQMGAATCRGVPPVGRAHKPPKRGSRPRVHQLYGAARNPAVGAVDAAHDAWAAADAVGACSSCGAHAVQEEGYPTVPCGRCNEIYCIRPSALPPHAAVWEPCGGAVAVGVRALPRQTIVGRFLVRGCRTDCN